MQWLRQSLSQFSQLKTTVMKNLKLKIKNAILKIKLPKSALKRVFKTRKRFYGFIIITTVVIIIAVALLMLAIVKPVLSVSFLPLQYRLNTSTFEINAEETYPLIELPGHYSLSTKNGERLFIDKYQTDKYDFVEGENILSLRTATPTPFLTLTSQDFQELKINVDRIKPTLEVTKNNADFVLLGDFNYQVKSEIGSRLYINDKESDLLVDEVSEKTLKVKDGSNTYSLYVIDKLNNRSDTIKVKFEAFQRSNRKRVTCNEISWPLNEKNLQLGYSSGLPGWFSNDNQCPKEQYVKLGIRPKGMKYPYGICQECGLDDYIAYYWLNVDTKQYIDILKKSDTKTRRKVVYSKEFKTKSGIKGTLLKLDEVIDYSFNPEYYHEYVNDDKIYFIFAKGKLTQVFLLDQLQMEAEFMEIITNLIIT